MYCGLLVASAPDAVNVVCPDGEGAVAFAVSYKQRGKAGAEAMPRGDVIKLLAGTFEDACQVARQAGRQVAVPDGPDAAPAPPAAVVNLSDPQVGPV
eukprot:1195752-Prorocentrum_minimum.AAC.7